MHVVILCVQSAIDSAGTSDSLQKAQVTKQIIHTCAYVHT